VSQRELTLGKKIFDFFGLAEAVDLRIFSAFKDGLGIVFNELSVLENGISRVIIAKLTALIIFEEAVVGIKIKYDFDVFDFL